MVIECKRLLDNWACFFFFLPNLELESVGKNFSVGNLFHVFVLNNAHMIFPQNGLSVS